jgi:hypothetical protein
MFGELACRGTGDLDPVGHSRLTSPAISESRAFASDSGTVRIDQDHVWSCLAVQRHLSYALARTDGPRR